MEKRLNVHYLKLHLVIQKPNILIKLNVIIFYEYNLYFINILNFNIGNKVNIICHTTNPPTPPSAHYGIPSTLHPQIYQSSFGWFLDWNVLMLQKYKPMGRCCFFG